MQRDGWVSLVHQNRYLRIDMERMRSRVRELEEEFISIKHGIMNNGRSHSLISSPHIKSRKLGRASLLPQASVHPLESMSKAQALALEKSIERPSISGQM